MGCNVSISSRQDCVFSVNKILWTAPPGSVWEEQGEPEHLSSDRCGVAQAGMDKGIRGQKGMGIFAMKVPCVAG